MAPRRRIPPLRRLDPMHPSSMLQSPSPHRHQPTTGPLIRDASQHALLATKGIHVHLLRNRVATDRGINRKGKPDVGLASKSGGPECVGSFSPAWPTPTSTARDAA